MSSFRIISLRSLTSTDQQTREWMSRARTPQTRAEIRRWARWETVSFCLLLIGGVCALSTPIIGVGLAVWHMIHDEAPWLSWFFGSLGITALFLLAGAWLGSHASDRRLTALYADGQASVGRLDEVITHPGGGDEQTTYEFIISAELPDSVVLRRKLYWGEDRGWFSPERQVGRAIRFRHNTFDPHDVHDVRFDGWGDSTKRARR